jgi:hypothetical protein
MAVDLKAILADARVVVGQHSGGERRLTDQEHTEVLEQLTALAKIIHERAPYRAVRDKARYVVTTLAELGRD